MSSPPPPLRVGVASLSLLLIVVEDLVVVVVVVVAVSGPLLYLNLSLSLASRHSCLVSFIWKGLGNYKKGENDEGKSPIKSCIVIFFVDVVVTTFSHESFSNKKIISDFMNSSFKS